MAGGGPVVSGPVRRYNGRQTLYLYFVVLLGGMGGLLLGWDNGVIGGVTTMSDFQLKFFPAIYYAEDVEKVGAASPYCKYDSQTLQLIVSSLYLSAAATAVIAASFARRTGRRLPLFISGIAFVAGAAVMAAAPDIGTLVAGRVLLGIGVGLASLIVPMYNSEMAPSTWRGGMNILFQWFVTIGILVAGLVNFGFNYVHPWGWRLPLALAGIPGLIMIFAGIVLPDSPISYIERGHLEKARSVLVRLRGVDDVDEEFNDMIEAARLSNAVKHPWRNLFSSRYRPQLVISLLFMCFQQFTGINAIIFYAPVLFSSLGRGATVSLENTCIIGAVNVLATIVAIFLVDRIGRKALLLEGGIQMIATEVVAGVVLGVEFNKYGVNLPSSIDIGVLIVICVFIAGFAWSWGPLGWLIPTEIQPLETRAAGSSLNTASNMIFTFVIGQCFLTMLCTLHWGVFIFFAGMVLIMTLFMLFFIPETKGRDLENTFRTFQEHWFWKSRSRVLEVHSVVLPGGQDEAVMVGKGDEKPLHARMSAEPRPANGMGMENSKPNSQPMV